MHWRETAYNAPSGHRSIYYITNDSSSCHVVQIHIKIFKVSVGDALTLLSSYSLHSLLQHGILNDHVSFCFSQKRNNYASWPYATSSWECLRSWVVIPHMIVCTTLCFVSVIIHHWPVCSVTCPFCTRSWLPRAAIKLPPLSLSATTQIRPEKREDISWPWKERVATIRWTSWTPATALRVSTIDVSANCFVICLVRCNLALANDNETNHV